MLSSRRLSTDPQLRNASNNAPPLKNGMNGTGVAKVQDLLADLGFEMKISFAHGKPDGIFGVETEKSVKAFQSAHGLTADGIVGTMTLRALDAEVLGNSRLEERTGPNDLYASYW